MFGKLFNRTSKKTTPVLAAFSHPAFDTLRQLSANSAVLRHKATGQVMLVKPGHPINVRLVAYASDEMGFKLGGPIHAFPTSDLTVMATSIDAFASLLIAAYGAPAPAPAVMPLAQAA
jgi:hypothetical protein